MTSREEAVAFLPQRGMVQHRAARPPSRLVTAAAYAVPLCVLPSAVWRVVRVGEMAIFGNGVCPDVGVGGFVYVLGLSTLSMGAALLTIGLVRPWGEIAPRWLPIVGGRTVPARLATGTAIVGATLIAALTLFALFGAGEPTQPLPPGCEKLDAAVEALYAPLVAWAPLVFLVAADYYRRRTH